MYVLDYCFSCVVVYVMSLFNTVARYSFSNDKPLRICTEPMNPFKDGRRTEEYVQKPSLLIIYNSVIMEAYNHVFSALV